jgi:hypothetical protein
MKDQLRSAAERLLSGNSLDAQDINLIARDILEGETTVPFSARGIGATVPLSARGIGDQKHAIEQLRVDILIRKKELLDMQYRLGQYERGLKM